MAFDLFCSWLRSSWQVTTTPVGRWVMRMADDVLLTCWPPAPDERYVSIRSSFSSISTAAVSSIDGHTSMAANDVWRRAFESNGLMRTRRCVPRSACRRP